MSSGSKMTADAEISQGCIATRLRMLHRRIMSIYEDALRPTGLRIGQLGILSAIAGTTDAKAADLCRALYLDPSTMSRDLDRMAEKKWITISEGVGRSQKLALTDEGRKLIKKALPAWRKAQEEAQAVLTPVGAGAIFGIAQAMKPG